MRNKLHDLTFFSASVTVLKKALKIKKSLKKYIKLNYWKSKQAEDAPCMSCKCSQTFSTR